MEDFSTTGITGDPEIQDDQTDTVKLIITFTWIIVLLKSKTWSFDQGGSEGEVDKFCLNSEISTFFYYSVTLQTIIKKLFWNKLFR